MKINFAFIVFIFFISSCTKDPDTLLFSMDTEVNFDIPAGLDNIQTHYFKIYDVPSFYDEKLTTTSTQDEEVDKILANRASIVPRFGNPNYSTIRDISIRVFDEDHPSREAFYLEYVDFNQNNELKLLSSLTNMKEILSNPTFDLEIRINFKTFTPITSENRIKLNFSAFAQP